MTDLTNIRPYGVAASVVRSVMTAIMLAASLFVVMAGSSEELSEKKPDQAKQRLKETKRALKDAQAKEKGLSKNLKSLTKERARLNKLLIDTAKRIQKGEVSLSKIESRLGELSEQEKLIRGSVAQRHSTIANLLAAMQRMGRQPPPVMATHREDALKMVRSAMLLASVYPQLKTQANDLAEELTNLVRIITSIKSQAIQLRAENDNLAKERLRVKGFIAAKKSRIAKNQTAIAAIRDAAGDHAKNVENPTELINKLDKEIKKTGLGKYEAELAKERLRGKTVSDKNLSKTAALLSPGRIKPARPFSKSKGLLPTPIQGRRIKNFGISNEYGGKSKGILIESRADAQITSPSDGWVVYAGVFRSYGKLLIINAGGGYHILLAGMKNIDVSEGQFVLAGEPIATMGPSKLAPKDGKVVAQSVLYVEFRKDGRPINPDPWWSNGPEKAQG